MALFNNTGKVKASSKGNCGDGFKVATKISVNLQKISSSIKFLLNLRLICVHTDIDSFYSVLCLGFRFLYVCFFVMFVTRASLFSLFSRLFVVRFCIFVYFSGISVALQSVA